MMKIALVTGASSGLGREFIRQLSDDKDIDEVWAVARREDRLRELAGITEKPVRAIPLDLTERKSIDTLKALLEEEKPCISVLINAAGKGYLGRTDEIPDECNEEVIDLNCRAAVDVTSIALPWVCRGSRILEICSTAGFQPIPGLNVYAASKAFLQSYTKTLHYELFTRGIHVTAVCPYWIKDTEFISGAKTISPKGFRHFPLASRAKGVVRWALFDSRLNLWVSTPGPVCLVHRIAAKFIPHFIMVPLVDLIRHI